MRSTLKMKKNDWCHCLIIELVFIESCQYLSHAYDEIRIDLLGEIAGKRMKGRYLLQHRRCDVFMVTFCLRKCILHSLVLINSLLSKHHGCYLLVSIFLIMLI